ncbi:hypothetical protein Tco_1307316, partial [Tanacetum coccineum]
FGEDAFDDIDDLVDEGMSFVQEKDAENQGKIGAHDTEVVKGSGDTKVLDTEKPVNTAGEGVSTASVPKTVSTAAPRTPPTTTTIVFDDEHVTMAMAQTLIKMKEEKAKEKRVVIKDVEDSSRPVRSITTLQPLPTIDPKYKGKGILSETESMEKTKKKVQGDAQMEIDAEIISNDDSEVDYEPLSRKFPIMNWEYQLLEKMEAKDMYVYKLTIADGSSSYHRDTQAFLRRLNRPDLNDLYRLVQERFQDHPLEGHDFCGVHTLFMDGTHMEINMLVEKKYPLIKELLEKMLNLQLEAKEESTMAFELIKFIKSLLEE